MSRPRKSSHDRAQAMASSRLRASAARRSGVLLRDRDSDPTGDTTGIIQSSPCNVVCGFRPSEVRRPGGRDPQMAFPAFPKPGNDKPADDRSRDQQGIEGQRETGRLGLDRTGVSKEGFAPFAANRGRWTDRGSVDSLSQPAGRSGGITRVFTSGWRILPSDSARGKTVSDGFYIRFTISRSRSRLRQRTLSGWMRVSTVFPVTTIMVGFPQSIAVWRSLAAVRCVPQTD